jgi:hypothetical protein
MLAARGRYVLFADLDLSTPMTYVEPFLELLDGGWDIVIASREAKGGARLGVPPHRRAMGKVFSTLVRLLLLPGVHDSQCGFKAFRREVAHVLFRSLHVFQEKRGEVRGPRVTAFDVEAPGVALRNATIISARTLAPRGTNGESAAGLMPHAPRGTHDLVERPSRRLRRARAIKREQRTQLKLGPGG